MPEDPVFWGQFTYYKGETLVPGTTQTVENSLCYVANTSAAGDAAKPICHLMDPCSNDGLILPLFFEETWPKSFRTIVYLVGLLYSFLGVSIVADIFMCAIEKITSKTKKIHIASTREDVPEVIEVQVWNATVANLTLMALGSSAPEILLSIIEIIGNNFEAGELGPGTIVGSAAFNLMAISAVCVYGIPNGETRRIDQIGVFGVTASFSIFAYLWLLIVLKGITPNVIDVWEAVLTFIFFPVLVLVAYAVDKRWIQNLICKKSGDPGVDDKQRQIELGTLQPGESTYRNPIFRFLDSSTFSTNYLRLTFQDLFKSYLASKRCRHSKDMQLSGLSTS